MSNVSASKFTATGSGFVMYSSTSAPSNPTLGQMYYNTSDDYLYLWNGSGWAKASSKLSASTFSTKIQYDYTGVDQSFIVPQGINRIKVKCWGGGGGGSSNSTRDDYGGAGGYSYGEITVNAGDEFVVVVGQGGRNTTGTYPATYGGGGQGTWDGSSHRSGAGGGLSGIFAGNAQVFSGASPQSGAWARSIIIAGGGGGANDQSSVQNSVQATGAGAAGGAGGGFIGGTGNTNNTNPGGTGGTQSNGGTNSGGNAGSQLRGGDAPGGNSDNPGGGGGYYGGASGDADANGAGGGSGYIKGTTAYPVENAAYFTGNYSDLPSQATADTDYASGIAVGGKGGGNAEAGHGMVVILY